MLGRSVPNRGQTIRAPSLTIVRPMPGGRVKMFWGSAFGLIMYPRRFALGFHAEECLPVQYPIELSMPFRVELLLTITKTLVGIKTKIFKTVSGNLKFLFSEKRYPSRFENQSFHRYFKPVQFPEPCKALVISRCVKQLLGGQYSALFYYHTQKTIGTISVLREPQIINIQHCLVKSFFKIIRHCKVGKPSTRLKTWFCLCRIFAVLP